MNDQINSTSSRREFLKTSTGAAIGGVLAANLSLSQKSLAAAFSPKGRAKFAAFLEAVQAAGLKLSIRARAA